MDSIKLTPPEKVDFTLRVPGSKSITNRALIAAALAEGDSTLTNVSFSDDTRMLVGALRQLGIQVESDPVSLRIQGSGGVFPATAGEFSMGNAGTALRFLVSLVSLGAGEYTVDGDERMRERPIGELVEALSQLGVDARCEQGCPPIHVRASGLEGGLARLDGGTSSQFVSSLLLVGPRSRRGINIQIAGELTSKPYVNMTVQVMEQFGAKVGRKDYEEFAVAPGRYEPQSFEVESDAAGANYFFAMAAVAGGRARVEGIGRNCAQGEARFLEILEKMGCTVQRTEEWIEVRGPGRLRAIDVDMNDCPDSVQTLSVVALCAEGETRIRNVGNLRVKETDRLRALATELAKFGAGVEEEKSGIRIRPSASSLTPEVETYDDHRMAMSFAVLGAVRPVTILNPRCVTKSFPGFFEKLAVLGVR